MADGNYINSVPQGLSHPTVTSTQPLTLEALHAPSTHVGPVNPQPDQHSYEPGHQGYARKLLRLEPFLILSLL